jgi:hypothetical protein
MEHLTSFEKVLIESGVSFRNNKVIDDYFLTDKVGAVRDLYKCCNEGIAEKMVQLAELEEEDRILEPEAGKGCILSKILKYKNHSYCEINMDFVTELLKISGSFKGYDFMDHYSVYDKIIMNPPFSYGQYAKHILHAYAMLKKGGILVALYPVNGERLTVINEQFIELLGLAQKIEAGKVCGECECRIMKIVKS